MTAVFLIMIFILAVIVYFLRKKPGGVNVDLKPGNIYTKVKDQEQNTDAEEGTNDFTFYKVLNSKEGDVIPFKVEPSKPDADRNKYKEPPVDKKTERIDSEIVKEIESRDNEGIIYTVQIAALKQEKAADEIAGLIRSKGFAPYIIRDDKSASIPIFKVRVGKFLSIVDANEVASVLKREGFATYVMKTPKQD